MQLELHHHVGIVMRRDLPVLGAARRRLGELPPLRVVEIPERLVDRAKVGLELADLCEPRRVAGIGADARHGRVGDLGSDVVEHEVRDAIPECSARDLHADRAAHRGPHPAQPADPERVEERGRQRRIEVQRIFLLRLRAPLAQAAPDRVRADDAIAVGEVPGEIVEVAAGARQAVPHHHDVAAALAPFHVVELAIEHGDVLRNHAGHLRAASLPTMPAGKK